MTIQSGPNTDFLPGHIRSLGRAGSGAINPYTGPNTVLAASPSLYPFGRLASLRCQ